MQHVSSSLPGHAIFALKQKKLICSIKQKKSVEPPQKKKNPLKK
jgi:hypothetical protein